MERSTDLFLYFHSTNKVPFKRPYVSTIAFDSRLDGSLSRYISLHFNAPIAPHVRYRLRTVIGPLYTSTNTANKYAIMLFAEQFTSIYKISLDYELKTKII